MAMTFSTRDGVRLAYSVLCVPSMGEVLKGFKSPVYETMRRKTPAEANCGRATDRGEEG